MKQTMKSGNATLVFNTDYVTPEDKAIALKEIETIKANNDCRMLLKKTSTA